MTDVLVTGGRVVTQDTERRIIEEGAVAIDGSRIEAVGPVDELEAASDADRVIDASGCAVIPGLINAHTHVSDILLRGSFRQDRGLLDWLYNVKRPGTLVMEADDHATAAMLYCAEAIQSGVTTFVENDAEMVWDSLETAEAKLDVYDRAGIRNVYGAGITDRVADETFLELIADVQARNPEVDHSATDRLVSDTETAIDGVEALIDQYHEEDGRQSVWPTPVVLPSTTPQALRESYRIATERDVMTTLHVAEAESEEQGTLSSVEYLRNVGYLGARALLGHCVQIDRQDVRILAETDTRVAHNFMANMRLATGFAPIVEMLDCGVTVGLGTDNAILNDTINPLGDVRAAAAGHKGYHRDPGVISAGKALDMVTIDAAKAIGRADDLGSLEAGKQADLAIVDLDHPHLTPCPDPVSALVYNAQGFEIDTLLCAGEVVMAGRELRSFEQPLGEITERANETASTVLERAGLS